MGGETEPLNVTLCEILKNDYVHLFWEMREGRAGSLGLGNFLQFIINNLVWIKERLEGIFLGIFLDIFGA